MSDGQGADENGFNEGPCYKKIKKMAKDKTLGCLQVKGIIVLEDASLKDKTSRPFNMSSQANLPFPIAFMSFRDHKESNQKNGAYSSIITGDLGSMLDDPEKRGKLFEYRCDLNECTL